MSTSEARTDKLIALLLAVLTVMLLLITVRDIGLTWDEPTYIVASESYPHWYAKLITQPSYALGADGIAQYWTISHEHPPLSKVWSGFVWLIARHFLDDLTAHRLGNILISGILVALLYQMVARAYGSLAGLVAALALLTMPRFFFHAHLAALDVPVAAMIFIVFYIFWLGHDRPEFKWTLLLGVAWGLALTTKIHALFIPPIILALWTLIFERRRYVFIRLVLMGLIGVGFFLLSWPWLYHDLLIRLREYVGFMTVGRLPVEQYYFGEQYTPPPWHFPFVITFVVVPFSIFLLAVVGAISMMRRREDRPLGGLLLLAVFVSLSIFSSGFGQVFDNERFMMPAFPFLAALAGVGFVHSVPIVEKLLAGRSIQLRRDGIVTSMVVVLFLPHLLLAYDLYPHLLSYYSEAIGGVYGANALGLETTYWCESYAGVLSFLNMHAKSGAVIYAECVDVLIYDQLHGLLRPDLKITGGPGAEPVFPDFQLSPANFDQADYVLIQERQSDFNRPLRKWMSGRMPIHELKYRRLRLVEIFARQK